MSPQEVAFCYDLQQTKTKQRSSNVFVLWVSSTDFHLTFLSASISATGALQLQVTLYKRYFRTGKFTAEILKGFQKTEKHRPAPGVCRNDQSNTMHWWRHRMQERSRRPMHLLSHQEPQFVTIGASMHQINRSSPLHNIQLHSNATNEFKLRTIYRHRTLNA